jgi:putative capsular polysaccharide synthesis protein
VQAGLENLALERPIYHAHFLSPERTRQTEIDRRQFFRTEQHDYLVRPWLNQFLLSQIQSSDDERLWKVITLTREPVGRNISAFFENLIVEPAENQGEYRVSSNYYKFDPLLVGVDEPAPLADLFFTCARHDSPIRFFDREIRDVFGIDVLQEGFDGEKGFQIYKSERAELLVLKLEQLAHCATDAFLRFLDIEDFELVNRNVGAKKVYAPLYDAFKKHVAIPESYLHELYDSAYSHTFYSDEEIAAAKSKWLKQER